MYPEEIVAPMKAELTAIGFHSLTSAAEVTAQIANTEGSMLLVFNSVCGCAAAGARPGVRMALEGAGKRPDRLVTVFAGVDTEAVAQARQFLAPYPASSPSIALFKDGNLIHFVERHFIEGRPAAMIAEHLKGVMDEKL